MATRARAGTTMAERLRNVSVQIDKQRTVIDKARLDLKALRDKKAAIRKGKKV